MSIEFRCPHCDKLLRTGEDKAGLEAKCPGCGERVLVPAPAAGESFEAGEEIAAHDDSAGEAEPAATKICPVCGNEIRAAAVKCRYCGEDLSGTGGVGAPRLPIHFDAGEVISTGWEIYKGDVGLCVAVVLIGGIINVAAGVPQEVLSTMIQNQVGGADATPLLFGLWCVCYFVGLAIQLFLTLGQTVFMVKLARGEEAQIGDLFAGGPYFLRGAGTSILFFLMVGLGLAACIVPGVIVLLMFWPFLYLLVDRNLPGIQALTQAPQITSGNWGSTFVLALAAFGVNVLGFLACCIGLLFTVPLGWLWFAVAYCRMTGQRTRLG